MFNLTMNAIPLSLAMEGPFKPKAWLDKVANPPVWTIGKGLTKLRANDGSWRDVRPDDKIDEDENEFQTHQWFVEEVEPILAKTFEGVELQPHQRDALSSIVYNAGPPLTAFPKTTALILADAPIFDILDEWVDGEWNGALGLYRRRLMEALVYGFGWPWENAYEAARTANWSTNWRELAGVHETELFEEELEPATKMEKLQYESAVAAGADETFEEFVAHSRGVPMTSLTKKVPVEAVEYLAEADKVPGNITVKRIEDSQRGKGYAKQEQGKQQIIVGAGGTAAVAIGAAEPVLKVVDKYSVNTIALVFIGLMALGVVTYYWGEWQRNKGEDEAEDLLG